jgi:excisionase family DNA binding protein
MILNNIFRNEQSLFVLNGEMLTEFAEQLLHGAKELYETKQQPEQYLTRKQAAELLDVDLSTLWRWNREGYLCTVAVGGKRRYKMSDIQRILKQEGGNDL